MNMTSIYVLIKPDETIQDIIAEICDDCNIRPDEHFSFSAIMAPHKSKDDGYYDLKINCIVPQSANPYTPEQLISTLLSIPEPQNKIRYVQPPLDEWLIHFQPLLRKLVTSLYPRYEKVVHSREDMMSILYLTITQLYRKGYYLHNTLIKKSFVNALNMEHRVVKGLTDMQSLDAAIGEDDDGKTITLLDQIVDGPSTEWARQSTTYTEQDYWSDMFEKIKARMLQDMSEFQFNRILIQLKTHTIDRSTSYKLNKYREIFSPGYMPRPNAKGGNKNK